MGQLGPTFFEGDTELQAGELAHYTTQRSLKEILRAGVLLPRRALPRDRDKLV